MVLSSKVRVGEGGVHGYCWFAAEDISAGAMLWELGDVKYDDLDVTKAEMDTWSEEKREKYLALAYMIDVDLWRGPDPENPPPFEQRREYYVNHSCDGNAWYINDNLLVACRDIKKGEEIVYDYALTECDPTYILAPKCLCGAAICRGLVTGNDWKLPELQKKYGNHFTSHIMKFIQQQNQQ